jgi:hypothetical protein
MAHSPRNTHTTHDPYSGYRAYETAGPNVIDPPNAVPAKTGLDRYRLSTRLVGQLERLAQTRFLIQEISHEDFKRWKAVDEQSQDLILKPRPTIRGLGVASIIQPLAQSVYCSSAIEGEQIHRNSIDVALLGQAHVAGPGENVTKHRGQAIHDIYCAYVWALSRPFPIAGGDNMVVTPEFICELHRMMFASTKQQDAGVFKQSDNQIERLDGTVLAHMLPHGRVEEFINALCERVNSQFIESDRHGSVSKFLSVAEFVCDFLAIHPFGDGNGRLARLLSTYLLERAGYHFARFYSLDAVILERHIRYYDALLTSQHSFYMPEENMSSWIEYYTDCVFMQWLRAYQYIKGTPANGSASVSQS